MKIPTTALMSVLLVATTIGAMGIPTVNVNVLNFPLDEEGNLRVSQMNGEQNVTITNFPTPIKPKKIIVVQNYTVTSTGIGYTFVATANVTGYHYVTIFVAYYNDNTDENLIFEPSCLGISANSWSVGLQQNNGYYETGWVGFPVYAPELTFRVHAPDSAGTIELTIVLYCYN